MKLLTKGQFLERAEYVHPGRYDYMLSQYKGNRTKIKIICKEHGYFWQTPRAHLSGFGCPLCGGTMRLTTKEFISRAREVHGRRYRYSLVDYKNARERVMIVCKKHGVFRQNAIGHIHMKQGCPTCNKESSFEREVRLLLESTGIEYEREKSFPGLKNAKPLRLDFYLERQKIAIELDGLHHTKRAWGGQRAYDSTRVRDKIKDDYCRSNGIRLIRISWTEKRNLEKILTQEIC